MEKVHVASVNEIQLRPMEKMYYRHSRLKINLVGVDFHRVYMLNPRIKLQYIVYILIIGYQFIPSKCLYFDLSY